MSRATTKDVKSLRHAAMRDAGHLRDQVRPGLPRLPQRSRQTRRATWYGDDSTLLAVVGAQEGNHTDRLLAHGLHLAEGRELALVLPAAFAYPTQFRRPWLTAEITLWTHEKGKITLPTPLSKAETLESVKGPETARAYTLGPRASDWVRILVEWATQHRELVEAHTSSLRGWSYNGQRVLTIRGKRRVVIHAGINAKTEPATAYRVDSQLDPRQFKEKSSSTSNAASEMLTPRRTAGSRSTTCRSRSVDPPGRCSSSIPSSGRSLLGGLEGEGSSISSGWMALATLSWSRRSWARTRC
jgi:hypothetical protein